MKRLYLSFFAILFLSFSLNVAAANKTNEILLSATSPFEDLVEVSLAKDDASIQKSITAANAHAAAIKKTLPATAAEQFAQRLQAIEKAATTKDHRPWL
jgi:hypothetical protein